jgi:ATP-binding cassette, subfamily B, bacterial
VAKLITVTIPTIQETKGMTDGITCLFFIARSYDKNCRPDNFLKTPGIDKPGRSIIALCRSAEEMGFRARCMHLTWKQLMNDVPLPCILSCHPDRFIVLFRKSGWEKNRKLRCFDPEKGMVSFTRDELMLLWAANAAEGQPDKGTALILEPSFKFHAKRKNKESKLSWGMVLRYFKNSRRQVVKLAISFLVTSMLQLTFPFLMQSIVDVGINTGNLQFVTVVLLAQIMLICSRLTVDLIRSRLLLYVSTVLNLSILSDFWIKLTRLPISYFDRQRTGNIMQNINDNGQIQNFLTGPALTTLYSGLNFVVFAIVLMTFKLQLFFIFAGGVTAYFFWMRLFFGLRRKVNYRIYEASSRENNMTLQMVQGMQEIRLQNIEQEKRWEWEGLKAAIFKLNFNNLSYVQIQQTGAVLINQSKDLLLTFLVAKLVIQGQLTLGAMLAVQYIIGQLSGPVEQFIGFVQVAQDAKMSMERLNAIHRMKDEEDPEKTYIKHLPVRKSIVVQDLSFSYPGNKSEPALKNIDLLIPEGKTTAIVGMSGSGKTTLLKILLRFYEGYEGKIRIGNIDLADMSASFWRNQCAVVMQDSYIFNDTIARNISAAYGEADRQQMREACRIANILDFVESLPDKFETRIGADGHGISQGQKQRLLIARAVYRNPAYIFLDESTNALDVENERCILENLKPFLKNKTVVVVAHRLSTVIHADKIVVINEGRIIEEGDHYELSLLKGQYFKLVKNQLELGN